MAGGRRLVGSETSGTQYEAEFHAETTCVGSGDEFFRVGTDAIFETGFVGIL
ncbi:MAG: hypothetical protein U0V54_10070 [Saprospiraceae bacterium]